MAIVASDNITVSNVNDGTITHTAYAYSADGTDRFTTVYPNLNLLVNSSAKTKDGFFKNFDKVENDYGEITVKGTNTYVGKDLWDAFSIKPRDYKPNDKYTMSMDVMFTSWNLPAGTTLTEFFMGQRYTTNNAGTISSYKRICAIDLPRDPSQMLNQWIKITQTSTIPPYEDPSVNTSALFQVKFTGVGEGSFTFRVRKPKQEQGLIATPYMPSASEVKTVDYPSYIGTYSDINVNSSTDPSKYTWAVFKGYDGVDGADAPTITNVQDQIYLSTSNTAQSGGSWGILIPTWSSGKYYWSRVATTFNNGTTVYSTPVLDEALNQVATNQVKVTQLTQDLDGFKTTVSNTYLSKSDASGTYADKVSVASQINQSATAVTSNVQSWTNNKLTAYSTTLQTDNSITNAVASKADKSQITQLSDQITSVVTQRQALQSNLIQNAGLKNNWDYWTDVTPGAWDVSIHPTFRWGVLKKTADLSARHMTVDFISSVTLNQTLTFVIRCKSNSSKNVFVQLQTGKGQNSGYSFKVPVTASMATYKVEIATSGGVSATNIAFSSSDFALNDILEIEYMKLVRGSTDDLAYYPASSDSASQSQITQLSDNINLRVSKGDVTSQINIEAGRTLIDTKQLLLNANTVKFSGSAFIPNAMIQNLSAEKITAGTLNAANVNVINLNAANITTGTLSGANLSMNLNTGAVQFTKGYIEGGNGRIRLDLDNSYLKSFNTYNNNGFEIQDGVLKLYSSALNSSSVAAIETDILARDGGVNISAIGGVSLLSTKYKASIGVGTGGLANGNEISLQGNAYFWNDLMVLGKKNAIHVTRDGVRGTPAYETAESYLGDIGGNYTRENCEVWVDIEKLFSDTVNTDIAYHIFLQAYDDAHFWVEDFKPDKFLIKSDKPMARFAWEIKAKRRGYENDRLVIQEGVDNKILLEAYSKGVFKGDSEDE